MSLFLKQSRNTKEWDFCPTGHSLVLFADSSVQSFVYSNKHGFVLLYQHHGDRQNGDNTGPAALPIYFL